MLGCLSKTNLRAVVAHSGGGPFGLDGSGTSFDNSGNLICPSKPVAAMQIIGTSDGLFDDARKARDYWRGANTCTSKTSAYDPSPCVQYSGCAADRPEVYCEIPGPGERMPTGLRSSAGEGHSSPAILTVTLKRPSSLVM
jgi:polyhydroxybutyrate depolymerase